MQRQETGCAFDRVMNHNNWSERWLGRQDKLVQGEALFEGLVKVQDESTLNDVDDFFEDDEQYCKIFKQHMLRETCVDIAKAGEKHMKEKSTFVVKIDVFDQDTVKNCMRLTLKHVDREGNIMEGRVNLPGGG